LEQAAFAFSRGTAFGRADFVVADSNAAAFGWIDRWPQWPRPALVLHGPQGAGKTHLAHLWGDRAAATLLDGGSLDITAFAGSIVRTRPMLAVDNADQAPEASLLHLLNACLEAGGNLLLTARQPPGIWRPVLADLDSRLRAVPAFAIGPPDDALLGAVLAKHFADRQVRVAPDLVSYLVRHMERSLAAAGEIAAALDAAALSCGAPVTVALARRMRAAGTVRYLPPDSDDEVT
jgi:chromosomal replication initiation ATPase DnaA